MVANILMLANVLYKVCCYLELRNKISKYKQAFK